MKVENNTYEMAVAVFTSHKNNTTMKEPVEKGDKKGEDGVTLELSTLGIQAQNSRTSNIGYQQWLSSLGFFSGSFDGNLSSTASAKAIRNFQKTYGISANGTLNETTKNKLSNAYAMYTSVKNNSGMSALHTDGKYCFDNQQIEDFARTWTFLRVGMGASSKAAAGVMGNIYAESAVSHDNAQNSSYPGKHNSSYSYKENDGVGYGLIQWTYQDRKQGLLNKANEMGISVTDINAQLAYFRTELTGLYSKAWSSINESKSVDGASDIFLQEIENPARPNLIQRREYAQKFYDYFKNN